MTVPVHVIAYVEKRGLSILRSQERRGRNLNWLLDIGDGSSIFVKKFVGDRDVERFQASLFAATIENISTPKVLESDKSNLTIYYEAIREEALIEIDFYAEASKGETSTLLELGNALAKLHHSSVVPPGGKSSAVDLSVFFEVIDMALYSNLTGGQIEALRIIHGDAILAQKLKACAEYIGRAGTAVIHGDCRLDQFVLNENRKVVLTDLETIRLGAPEVDLGGILGSLLHEAVSGTPTDARLDVFGKEDQMEAEIVHIGDLRLGIAFSQFAMLLRQYNKNSAGNIRTESIDLEQVMRLAGYFMFDRLLASAEQAAIISHAFLGAAGVGKYLLLRPDEALLNLKEVENAH